MSSPAGSSRPQRTGHQLDSPEADAARLEAVLETALFGIVTIDVTGKILAANRACGPLLGYTQEELVGENVRTLAPSPHRERHDDYLARYLAGGERRIIGIGREVFAQHREGHQVPIFLAVSETRVAGEKIFVGILHDQTDAVLARVELQKRLLQQEVVAELGVRALSDLSVEAFLQEATRLVAETLEVDLVKVLEYGADANFHLVAGVGWEPGLVGEYSITAHQSSQATYTVESAQPVIVPDTHAETRFRTTEILSRHGARSGLSVIIHGDSERPYGVFGAHTRELREFSSRDVNFLQSVANVLAEAVAHDRANARLLEQESLAQVGEMAAVVAHEVKNMQAGVAGALRVIRERLEPDSEERGVIQDVLRRLDTLHGFVGDVLAFARPRDPQLSSVPAFLLLEDTIEGLSRHPDCESVRFTLSGADCRIPCDAELLQPVFINLLLNAAHAMGNHGEVHIAVETTQRADGLPICAILIIDTGCGIPPENLERVFQPFFTTKHRGSGLGLAIAKRLVAMHGGAISLSCPESGGTIVRLELPVDE